MQIVFLKVTQVNNERYQSQLFRSLETLIRQAERNASRKLIEKIRYISTERRRADTKHQGTKYFFTRFFFITGIGTLALNKR